MVFAKKLHNDAIIPARKHHLDSGFDLHALDVVTPAYVGKPYVEGFTEYVLYPRERVLVRTGIALDLRVGHEAQVRPRSGLALKHGIVAVFGTVDANYHGDVGVILMNTSDELFTIKKGDRIGQLVFAAVGHHTQIHEVKDIGESDRGTNGFGSTGRESDND